MKSCKAVWAACVAMLILVPIVDKSVILILLKFASLQIKNFKEKIFLLY